MGNLDIGKIPNEDKNSFPADVELTDSQRSKRAQANWNKLKTHISAMRLRANFLVTFLDEENEMKQESMFINDQVNAEDEVKNDD